MPLCARCAAARALCVCGCAHEAILTPAACNQAIAALSLACPGVTRHKPARGELGRSSRLPCPERTHSLLTTALPLLQRSPGTPLSVAGPGAGLLGDHPASLAAARSPSSSRFYAPVENMRAFCPRNGVYLYGEIVWQSTPQSVYFICEISDRVDKARRRHTNGQTKASNANSFRADHSFTLWIFVSCAPRRA